MPTSILPPRTLKKIESLPAEDRKIYIQELQGVYGSKVLEYDRALKTITDPYIIHQREHFQAVLDELDALMVSA